MSGRDWENEESMELNSLYGASVSGA